MRTIEDQKYKRIIERRDPRYDGRFYWGVKTTGIYCRPICPARPKPENIIIFKSATEAEKDGYRPCLRCRPDLAPGSQRWEGTAVSVARALRLMDETTEAMPPVEDLAARLGMSDRHLRRLFTEHLGASPLEIMINRRLHLARQLITETSEPITEIAFAAGFQSIRRFNEAFKELYLQPPSALRRQPLSLAANSLELNLAVRQPYDWNTLLGFLQRHQIHGIEEFTKDGYIRYIPQADGPLAQVTVRFKNKAIQVRLQDLKLSDIRPLLARLRQLFDVDHNPSDLPRASRLQSAGIRVPGCFDPFEGAVSIILSQLVSCAQAGRLLMRLVQTYGHRLTEHGIFAFPMPALLQNAELESIGVTRQRADAIRQLSRLIHEGRLDISRTADIPATRASLAEIPGVGPWTVELIAMRCLGDTDAFPRKDLAVQKAYETVQSEEEHWLSLRSYLTHILWRDYKPSRQLGKGAQK